MTSSKAESLRKAIENLINVKLHDALAKPGGLERLIAHRVTGVASWDVRNAERQLEQTLAEMLASEAPAPTHRPAPRLRKPSPNLQVPAHAGAA